MIIIFTIIIITILSIIGYTINIYSYNYNQYKNKIAKIFLINLKRRKDRLDFFKKYYNLDLPLTIIEAVDGNTLDLEQLLKDNIINDYTLDVIKKPRKYHYELTHEGSIGCYLSHYNIWKSLIDNYKQNKIFLIFEDDSIITNISLNEINYRLSSLPPNWDIYIMSDPDLCYLKKKINKNLYKVNRFFLTNAYIINIKAIKKIFNTNTFFPIVQQFDSYLSELCLDFNLNVYVHNKTFNFYKQSITFNSDIQESNLIAELAYDRYKYK